MNDNEEQIASIIADAKEVKVEPTPDDKPRLLVDKTNPHMTVAELRDVLASRTDLFERGTPVRLAYDKLQNGHVAQSMTAEGIIRLAHVTSRPYSVTSKGEVNVAFPKSLAMMYLDWRGEWNLPPLSGIASSPLLREDGTIILEGGYDAQTGVWVENVPETSRLVCERPNFEQATFALLSLRQLFRTFCFADANLENVPGHPVPIVDISLPPGRDESAFLTALMTAVCRPSLPLAPGILIKAPSISGAGAGKGLLARCICLIAFGRHPHAVTGGIEIAELEKRIAAELMQGGPVVFLDNLNNTSFRSDLLASAITERPSRVRVLGKSKMVQLNSSALIILTGNGLSMSEDLARRFIAIELDAQMENPESRDFDTDLKAEVLARRNELIANLLTIWRWGRQAKGLKRGKPLGSFDEWSRWVRDPLIALGCQDPVERVAEAKEADTRRQNLLEIFSAWHQHHGDVAIGLKALNDAVTIAIDPHKRGRQFVAAFANRHVNTRIGNFVLERHKGDGTWATATYRLKSVSADQSHRSHRGHGSPVPENEGTQGPTNVGGDPMPPMTPMPSAPPTAANENKSDQTWEEDLWKDAI